MARKLNKSVLITGAEGGIGGAITDKLCTEGFIVHGVGRERTNLHKLQNKFGKNKIKTHVSDFTSTKSICELVKKINIIPHKIDWIILCAGHLENEKNRKRFNRKTLEKTFEVNTYSVIHLTLSLIKKIKENGGVIIISSTAGLNGNSSFPIYSSSKAAVNIFAKSLAKTFSEQNKTIISICPGPTNTPMRDRVFKDGKKHQDPKEVAGVIYEIISKQTTYESGSIIEIRNGIRKLIF